MALSKLVIYSSTVSHALKRHLGIILSYLVITLVMTWPVALHLTTHIAGQGGDPWQTMWRFTTKIDEAGKALQAGHLGSFIASEFFGGGEARLINISVWPWEPLHLMFGQPTAYNLVYLLSFVLAGYAMCLLVVWLLQNYAAEEDSSPLSPWLAAWLAGLYYMFLPIHVAHAQGHFGAMQIQWLPLAILAWLAWLKRPTVGKTVALALVVAMQAWTEHHYALWLLITLVIVTGFNWQRVRNIFTTRRTRGLAVGCLLLTGLMVVLPYFPTIRAATAGDNGLNTGSEQAIRFSADVVSYIMPAVFHPVWGNLSQKIFGHTFTGNVTEATQYLGILPLLLLVFFHQQIPRAQKRLWTAVAVVFFVISLGPRLHVWGHVLSIPLPYALIDTWPVWQEVRTVGRAGVLVGLAAAVLLGWVLHTQLRRRGSAAIVAVVIILEFLCLPIGLQSAQLSPVYQVLASLPGTKLIEIPAATNYVAASRALYASTVHHKEVVGNIALERGQDPAELQEIRGYPSVRQLLYLRTTDLKEDRREFFDQRLAETLPDVLQALDATAILVHTDSVSPEQQAILHTFLSEQLNFVVHQYPDAILYTRPDAFTVATDGVFLKRGDGWEHVGLDRERASIFAEVSRVAEVVLTNSTGQPVTAEFTINFPPESTGTILVKAADHEVARATGQAGGALTWRLKLSPGENNVQFINPLPDKVIIQNPRFKIVAGS